MLNTLLQGLDWPLTLNLLLLLAGVWLQWLGKKEKTARFFTTTALLLFLLLSNRLLSTVLMGKLENKYPSFFPMETQTASDASIRYIVVLGGQSHQSKKWPVTSQIGTPMLIRLVEAVHLHNALPLTKLILSGGGRSGLSDSEMMKKLALLLGVAEKDILLETKSSNTYEEALFLKDLLRGEKFLLVTSAKHMPRAMALFQKAGLDPLAAPTGHLIDPDAEFDFRDFIPRSGNMGLFSELFYEYLGFVKAKLMGRI